MVDLGDSVSGIRSGLIARRELLVGSGAAALALALPRIARAGEAWETIAREGGIVVQLRPEPGRQFPSYRSICRMPANRWKILAVFADADRHSEWAHRCVESRLIDHPSPTEYVVYSRNKAPWPAKDRDIVFKGKITVRNGGNEIVVRSREVEHRKAPSPPQGTIRIPRMRGMVRIVTIDDEHSMVLYQVNADPGGRVPDWIVKMTSKNLPLITMRGLRDRVRAVGDTYDTTELRGLADL